MNNTRDTFGELRGLLDGQDPFMAGGHRIIVLRKSNRKTPLWVYDNQMIQNMLLRAFPKLGYHPTQRRRAARWARVIQLFFRARLSYSDVAEELGVTRKLIKTMVRNIRRRAAGRRTSGVKSTGRPTGRPRKVFVEGGVVPFRRTK
jgi:hypothetical protein